MADGFTQTSMQLGGQIVGRRAVKGGDRDFGALVRTLPQDFDLLFYGGMFEATFILKAMRAAGLSQRFASGDGCWTAAVTVLNGVEGDPFREIAEIGRDDSAGSATNTPVQSTSYELTKASWYEWFVATSRGREAIEHDRRRLCRFLWKSWSPNWRIPAADFEAAAPS
jgi:ABC-type branched-subunit amino acid transport system substrate-binding protein